MPSAVPVTAAAAAASAGAAIRPNSPDTVRNLCLGMELKFLLLGLPLSECTRRPHERPAQLDVPVAGCDDRKQLAYSALARAIESGTSTSTGAGLCPCLDTDGACASLTAVQPRAISKYDIAAAGHRESDYWPSHWIVKKANSVEHVPEDPRPDCRRTDGVAVPVELNSPKLAWDDADAPRLVSTVLARLRAFPTAVNYTCDVHVHVGRCDGTSFALSTLKKLATVFWLAEPVLRSVRNPRSPNFANIYTWGFEQRRFSRLALALGGRTHGTEDGDRDGCEDKERNVNPDAKTSDTDAGAVAGTDTDTDTGSDSDLGPDTCDADADADADTAATNERGKADNDWQQCMGRVGPAALGNDALRAIWRTASALELGQLLSGAQREYRRLGFNFSAFGREDERARTNPRTIEFRILEGTLEEDLVQGWLHICGKLVELGLKGRQARFRSVVRYLLAQQPAYEDLRTCADLGEGAGMGTGTGTGTGTGMGTGDMDGVSFASRPGCVSGPGQATALPRDKLYADLMDRIGVSAAVYAPFQRKIHAEYGRTAGQESRDGGTVLYE